MTPEVYLHTVVKPLLKHPEDLEITPSKDDMGVLLTIGCNKDDMGIIIGKQGKTADAIRLLTRIVGIHHNARISVRISEPLTT